MGKSELNFVWQGNYAHVFFGAKHTGFVCVQEQEGTRLYKCDGWKKVPLPSNRYSMASDLPDSGNPGRVALELDIEQAIINYQAGVVSCQG